MRSVIRLHSLPAPCEAGCLGPAQQPGNRNRFDVWPYSNSAARCDVNAVNPRCEQSPAGTCNQWRAIKNYLNWPRRTQGSWKMRKIWEVGKKKRVKGRVENQGRQDKKKNNRRNYVNVFIYIGGMEKMGHLKVWNMLMSYFKQLQMLHCECFIRAF